MLIVHVDIQVKPEFVASFQEATIENARSSIEEPGIARFDFLQSTEDVTRFTLIEVYRTPADVDLHKQTAHYQKWRDTVESMMAAPRSSHKFMNIHPGDSGWFAPSVG